MVNQRGHESTIELDDEHGLTLDADDDLPYDGDFDSQEYQDIQKRRAENALEYLKVKTFSDKRLPNSGDEFDEEEFIKEFQKSLDDAEDIF